MILMKKNIYEITFTNRQINTIEKRINKIIDSCLESHPGETINNEERDFLIRKAKDQLTVYIKNYSPQSDKWNMSYKKIPITVYSNTEKKESDLLSVIENNKDDKFYLAKNKWYDFPEEHAREGVCYRTFVKKVYEDMYESALTAGFYAIESYLNVRKTYPNG